MRRCLGSSGGRCHAPAAGPLMLLRESCNVIAALRPPPCSFMAPTVRLALCRTRRRVRGRAPMEEHSFECVGKCCLRRKPFGQVGAPALACGARSQRCTPRARPSRAQRMMASALVAQESPPSTAGAQRAQVEVTAPSEPQRGSAVVSLQLPGEASLKRRRGLVLRLDVRVARSQLVWDAWTPFRKNWRRCAPRSAQRQV